MSDSYGACTTLLLGMEGANNSTSFVDSSYIPNTIAVNGNTKVSTTQSKWGNGSAYFDGSNDYLAISGTRLYLSDADFTIEAWVYVTSLSNIRCPISKWGAGQPSTLSYTIYILTDGTISLCLSTNGTSQIDAINSNSGVISINNWHHIAATRYNGYCHLWVDGSEVGTSYNIGATALHDADAQPFNIGAAQNGGYASYEGYIQDCRITKNIARYTATFTPPSAKLPDPDPSPGRLFQPGVRCDIEDGGAYRITGNVDELGVYGSYRVRLFDRQSGRCLRETWSAADGSYSFPYIAYRYQGYFAVAFDHGDNPLNAAIADLITPELMP